MPGPQELTICHAKQEHRDAAHAFHVEHAGEHLWARSVEHFQELIDGRNLFIVRSADAVHGLCYVVFDEEESEFGGVYLDDALRGKGIAAALGRTAIASLYISASPHSLIAHVHEENDLPRDLLQRLGFEATPCQIVAPPDAPLSMARNERGEVRGDVFRFRRSALAEFVDWFEAYSGTLPTSAGPESVKVNIHAEIWHQQQRWLPALREMAAEENSSM